MTSSPECGPPRSADPQVFRRDIEEAVQAADIAATDTLTTADLRKLSQHLVEELRRRGYLPDTAPTGPAPPPPAADAPPAR
ncbi:hypothetical protein [Streptomyces sp. NRRL F-5755]|uniref:hypothetical protein n=1 Tax=Streptomyces sp. NRRL F-5755 TaxID=1519475 RepID=UPI00133147DB|nr:hypothetical protein [Streptomyces sp. NRRL F-5755]